MACTYIADIVIQLEGVELVVAIVFCDRNISTSTLDGTLECTYIDVLVALGSPADRFPHLDFQGTVVLSTLAGTCECTCETYYVDLEDATLELRAIPMILGIFLVIFLTGTLAGTGVCTGECTRTRPLRVASLLICGAIF